MMTTQDIPYTIRRSIIEAIYIGESCQAIELVTKAIVKDCEKFSPLVDSFDSRIRLQMHFENRLRFDHRWSQALSQLLFLS